MSTSYALCMYDDESGEWAAMDARTKEHRLAALAEIREFREMRELLRELLAQLCENPSSIDGNAPGHAHQIPGIWDDDNGDLAGKPCEWCAAWAKAMAMGLVTPSDQAQGAGGGLIAGGSAGTPGSTTQTNERGRP